ncbi:hypothetical protein [Hartmannibacter diazotrophicus]|nr:hypothetical protein [Hartmannibacter diazotrophicus]
MTALIVFGLSRIEMTEGASQMAFGNSPITKAATKAQAVSAAAQPAEAMETSRLPVPADAQVRVILALK